MEKAALLERDLLKRIFHLCVLARVLEVRHRLSVANVAITAVNMKSETHVSR